MYRKLKLKFASMILLYSCLLLQSCFDTICIVIVRWGRNKALIHFTWCNSETRHPHRDSYTLSVRLCIFSVCRGHEHQSVWRCLLSVHLEDTITAALGCKVKPHLSGQYNTSGSTHVKASLEVDGTITSFNSTYCTCNSMTLEEIMAINSKIMESF